MAARVPKFRTMPSRPYNLLPGLNMFLLSQRIRYRYRGILAEFGVNLISEFDTVTSRFPFAPSLCAYERAALFPELQVVANVFLELSMQ